MMDLSFTPNGWKDYLWWIESDRNTLKELNALLREVARTPYSGTGKPELLKHVGPNTLSRRITHQHRLVYQVRDGQIVILAARYHYGK